MDLSITFSAGPLAQIGLNIPLNLPYQLAVGAHGWYKAHIRSKSLREVLQISGGMLVSAPSFNLRHYSEVISSRSQIRGAFIHNGSLLPTALPKASTALSGDEAMTCLRALITALLSLYDTDTTTTILAASMPVNLIKNENESATFEIDGPATSALREYVEAVAIEEDNDLLRRHILDYVSARRSSLIGSENADIQASEPVHSSDMNLTIGLLKWLLSPTQQRSTVHYPTRSLRVWSVANILEFLGFELSTLGQAVSSASDYNFFKNAPLKPQDVASVFLVTSQFGDTDLMQVFGVRSVGYSGLRPQIMPMRAIPWSAFRHLSGSDRQVNVQYLADVWQYALKSARESVLPPAFNSFGFPRMNATPRVRGVASELHRSLLRLYSPDLAKFCGRPMERFVPDSVNAPGWNPDDMAVWLEELDYGGSSSPSLNVELADNSLVVAAIVLGTVYGVVSRCCLTDGQELDEDAEVVFRPDLLFEHDRLKGWATAVGRVVVGTILFEDWNGCVYEALLGVDFGMFHGVGGAGQQAGRQSQKPIKNESLFHGRTILGCQANGMAALTAMAIEPSIKQESLLRIHIHRGQILSLPLHQGHIVEAADWSEPWSNLQQGTISGIEDLDSEGWDTPDYNTRADLEPCWEEDSTRVVIRIRRKGHLVGTVDVARVKTLLTADYIPCHCKKPNHLVDGWPQDEWGSVQAESLMDDRSRWRASAIRSIFVHEAKHEKKILLDARRGSAMALYGIGLAPSAAAAALSSYCLACTRAFVAEKPHIKFVILSLMGNEPNLPTKGYARQAASILDNRIVFNTTT